MDNWITVLLIHSVSEMFNIVYCNKEVNSIEKNKNWLWSWLLQG